MKSKIEILWAIFSGGPKIFFAVHTANLGSEGYEIWPQGKL